MPETCTTYSHKMINGWNHNMKLGVLRAAPVCWSL